MIQTKITLFANFLIDSKERFKRLKFSFKSIKRINFSEWIINIRGKYKHEVSDYLKKHIKKNLNISYLESRNGWNFDTSKLIKSITGAYVFIWLEDHVCMVSNNYFHSMINNLKKNNIDIISYSRFSRGNNIKSFENIKKKNNKYFYFLNYNYENHNQRLHYVIKEKLPCQTFIISMPSIFKKKLFYRVVTADDPLIKRWPKNTPFNVEKGPKDFHWLPLKYAVSKKEIFSSIDDNAGVKGTSLIERKIYKSLNKKRITNTSNIGLIYNITLFMIIREFINKIFAFLFFKN